MTIQTALHKNILVSILKNVYTDHQIATYLGFKGGTAAMLFYNLSRFSVDLDFDLLDEKKEDLIVATIENILTKYGDIKKIHKTQSSVFFLLSYKDKLKGSQNIKVELSKRKFGSRYEIKQYLGIAMQVMVQEDMVAHKLVAMHERIGKTNRDIFDVWFFFHNNWSINTKIIEQRTNMSYKDFLEMCVNDLERMSNRTILSGIGDLLDEEQKKWVKSKLISESIFLLKLAHSNIS